MNGRQWWIDIGSQILIVEAGNRNFPRNADASRTALEQDAEGQNIVSANDGRRTLRRCQQPARRAPPFRDLISVLHQVPAGEADPTIGHGVMCNAIAPGFFPTELTEPVFSNPEVESKLARQTAVGRNGRLEDLCGVTVFFAGAASNYITGQTLHIDGGFTAK